MIRRLVVLFLVALLGIANFLTQRNYLRESADIRWDKTLEQAHALSQLPPQTPVAMGLQDYTTPSLAALYTQGHPTWDLNGSVATPLLGIVGPDDDRPPSAITDGSRDAYSVGRQIFKSERFYLEQDGLNHHFHRFDPPAGIDLAETVVLLPTSRQSVVNASQDRPADGKFYVAKLSDQRDTLIQIDTSLGHIITPGFRENIGLWQFENDFAGSGRGMQAAGQHILFEVLGPVSGSRLLFDFTSAGLAGQDRALPAATIYDSLKQRLDFTGRGSARSLSAPIEPREIDGHYYVAVDLDQSLAQFHGERHGLAGLYNTALALDTRGLVGFVRNISLLTPEQAAALQPPAAVPSFPAGLQAPGLLYSGVSEDGWVADRAWFRLAATAPSDRLRIKGDIAGFSQKLLRGVVKIRVDGEAVGEQKLVPGALELDLPILPKDGPRRIELEATATDYLPAPDGRLVSFHLTSVALEQRPGGAP